MKKIVLVLLSILAIIGIIIGGWKVKEQMEYNYMVEVVQSEEVKEIIENDLKELDDKSFTTNGTIQSYVVDIKSVEHNPMGGIMFDVYINNNKELNIGYIIDKDVENRKVEYSSGTYSKKLIEILEGVIE